MIGGTHLHVVSPDTETYPRQPIGGVPSSWSQAHSVTHEELIAVMDDAGIDKAIAVQASTASGFDNRYPPAKNIAAVVSTPTVKGISNASAVGPLRPGMTPNDSPTRVPKPR